MHIVQKDGPITPFTNTGWEKCIISVFDWKDLGTKESLLAEEAVRRFHFHTQEPAWYCIPANTGYHRDCYSHFTNIAKIKRAQERKVKAALIQKESGPKGWYQTCSVKLWMRILNFKFESWTLNLWTKKKIRSYNDSLSHILFLITHVYCV